jgi:hypothetical protein
MPCWNSTGKLMSVAMGSSSAARPLKVKAMLTVLCGLWSQSWPVVMAGRSCARRWRADLASGKWRNQ